GLHDPQPAQGGAARGGLRRARGTDRTDRRGRGSGPGAAGPRRQRDHGSARPAARAEGWSSVAISQGPAAGAGPARARRGGRRADPVGHRERDHATTRLRRGVTAVYQTAVIAEPSPTTSTVPGA